MGAGLMGIDFRSFIRTAAVDETGQPGVDTVPTDTPDEQEPEGAPAGSETPPSCSYCGSAEFGPAEDNGRIARATCRACGGTMVSHDGGYWQPDLIGSPHNHPKTYGDPSSGGVGGIWAPVLRTEDLTRTAMPGMVPPPEGLHFDTYDAPVGSEHYDEAEESHPGWSHHLLRAHLPERGQAGIIYYSRTPEGSEHPGVAIHDMRTNHGHRGKGIASAMQDELRRQHPQHMIDHGSRTPAGQRWHDQYTDPGDPKLDLDHPDNVHKWKYYRPTTLAEDLATKDLSHMGKLAEPEQLHLMPVRSAGYKGFVEAEDGHEEQQRAFERQHFPEDMQHPSVDEHLDHAVGHHAVLHGFLNSHIDNHDFWHKHGQVEEIDHNENAPYATQPYLAGHHVARYLQNRDDPVATVHDHGMSDSTANYPGTHYPMMVRHEGNHFVVEGHHRVAADMMKGQPTKTFVYDADKHGFPEIHPMHAYNVTQPGLAKTGRRRVRRCLFQHDDPRMAAAHAAYNHDDGICVASEQVPRPEPKPLIRGMGPSHDGTNCPICNQGLSTEARHRRVREISRPAAPQPGTGNVHPAPHPNPQDGSLTWYHGTDFHPEEDHDYRDEHEDWEGPHTGLDGHPVGTGEKVFDGDPGGRLKAPVRDAWTAGHHAAYHWNTDLGTHLSSLKSVANQFAGEKMGTSRVAHAHLHMANPAYFDNEHEMGAAAIEHARSKNIRFLPKDDRAHNAFTDGRDDDVSDHPKSEFEYGYVGDHVSPYDSDTRQAISNFDKNGVEGHHDDHSLEHIDRYLATHPRREEITSSFKQHLMDKGHDGIIYGNELEGPHEHPSAIAFHDHQINVHKWDWKHPDKAHMNEHNEAKPHEDQHALISANPQAWPGAAYGSINPELGFHLIATWADVRNKAKRIRAEGGVHIVVSSVDGIGGNVKGDTGVYETILSYRMGSSKVSAWQCGCAWAAYAFNRSPAFKRFEGRMCSHALALQFEAQSRGMFGNKVLEDVATRPSWLRDKARSRYDRDTGRHDLVNASLHTADVEGVYPEDHGLDLAHPPVYGYAVMAALEGQDPGETLQQMMRTGMAHAPARALLREALADPLVHTAARRCPDCGSPVPVGADVCPHCHAELGGDDAGLHMAAKDEDGYEAPTHAGLALKAADTGRVLMLQRSNKDESDPARGTWEFPGGGIEDHDHNSLHGAMREFAEEVGQPVPQGGTLQHVHRNGNYVLHTMVIPSEDQITLHDGRIVTNPDDPDGDDAEQAAWWHPEHAQKNPALREECRSSPWKQIKEASRGTTATFSSNDPLGDFAQNPVSPGRNIPLPGDQENPASTGFATGGDPDAFRDADSRNMSLPTSFEAAMHTAASWESGPHIMTHDDYDDDAGAVFPKGTSVHVKRHDIDSNGVGWAVVDHPGGQHGEAYIDPYKIMRQQHGGPDDGAESWAAHERSYRGESPGQAQQLDHVLGPKAEPIPEQHRHLTEAPGNDGRMPWGGHQKGDEHSHLGQPWDMSGLGHEHFDPENAAHHSDEWHAGAPLTPHGLPIRSLNTLHEGPEPALPSTEGDDDSLWDDLPDPAHQHIPLDTTLGRPDPRDDMHPEISDLDATMMPNQVHASVDDIVARFQATAGGKALGQTGNGPDDASIAEAARQHLAKTALKDFSHSERQELIGEGAGVRARNFGDLQIQGTHYENIAAALEAHGDPDDVLII